MHIAGPLSGLGGRNLPRSRRKQGGENGETPPRHAPGRRPARQNLIIARILSGNATKNEQNDRVMTMGTMLMMKASIVGMIATIPSITGPMVEFRSKAVRIFHLQTTLKSGSI